MLRQPNNHVGFGFVRTLLEGTGSSEITVMFRELFHRLPDIKASGEPDVLVASFIHGVKHLPATFNLANQPTDKERTCLISL